MKTLKVGIVSDLHCHPERERFRDNNTYLFSDLLRAPSNEHPVESLLEVINSEPLRAKFLLCPGDFTDQSDKQGFFSGWSYVTEISRALKCEEILATIGNHDIDSRHTYSSYSFDIPKKIKQKFPLSPDLIGTFWSKGFTFIENDDYQILIINSTHFHTHFEKDNPIDNPAIKGKVDPAQLEEIREYLLANDTPDKIKIALCHHHPVKHSRLALGEHDDIENGADLLKILGEFRFDLIIHGHKHDPWLRYCPTDSGYQIPILSSGSFSATNQILYTTKLNYFHLIDITKSGTSPAFGIVTTWTFRSKMGWARDRDDGFYPFTGFGYLGGIDSLVNRIKAEISGTTVSLWATVLAAVPEIQHLTPDKMNELQLQLNQQGISLSGMIGTQPKHIYHDPK